MKLSPPPVNYLVYMLLVAFAAIAISYRVTKVRTTLGGKV